ncbi:MAG: Crp/Fnr family transcriptional regulator [Acidimicrobiia bacterium]|nr:Crp/Fnr family transcriptional regulator [Acidimicrobiia bacterium]
MTTVLTDETWEWIERNGRRVTFRRGDRLLHEADEGDHVYAIRSGHVKALAVTSKGDEVLLAVRGPNQTIGELGALDPGPRESSAVAKDDVVAWVLTGDLYLRLLREIPDAAVAQLTVVISRFRESIRHYIERSDELTSRIANRLLILMDENGEPELSLTQSELATWVGATREATVRGLGRLRESGAIETARGTITVSDAGLLARFT